MGGGRPTHHPKWRIGGTLDKGVKMGELKLCPFCGEPGVLRRLINDLFVVCCKNEKCYMIVQNNVATTPEKAIEIWNTRPIEDAMQKQINKGEYPLKVGK
ncbi:MAG: Lar family restriction alleviation protein [Lutibacter sp.]|jgi:ssDNA-binding Zn-finger/Zn-ribbon topoisomerase 1